MLPRQFKWCIVTNCCGGHQAAETCQNNDTLMMLNYSCPSLLWGQNLIALQWRGPQTIRPTDKIERDNLSFFPSTACGWIIDHDPSLISIVAALQVKRLRATTCLWPVSWTWSWWFNSQHAGRHLDDRERKERFIANACEGYRGT